MPMRATGLPVRPVYLLIKRLRGRPSCWSCPVHRKAVRSGNMKPRQSPTPSRPHGAARSQGDRLSDLIEGALTGALKTILKLSKRLKAANLLPSVVGVFNIDFTLEILKVDPSPAHAHAFVTVVYRVTNFTRRSLPVKIDGHTDEGTTLHTYEAAVPPQDNLIGTAQAFWTTPGPHQITVEARERISQIILVPGGGPTPIPTPGYLYSDPWTDVAGVQIYEGVPQPVPTVTDAGPSEPAGSTNGAACAAGVVADIKGTNSTLYVVSKTGGVWVSSNGGRWRSCPGSPRVANRIAVDPTYVATVAVAGRAGDAIDPHLDTAGLWESTDVGNTWSYTYDPFPDTGAQQIYDIAYTPAHTLLLATAAGVGRRPPPGGAEPAAVVYPDSALGGPVRALAVSESKVWARTDSSLLFSVDDGQTWTKKALPTSLNLPGFPGVVPLYDNTAEKGNGNDRSSLAAFDDVAYLIMQITDAAGKVVTSRCPLLVFDVSSGTFKAQFTNDNDGRGLGGTRFLRAYTLNCRNLSAAIGDGRQLFYGSGQGLQQALSENTDRTVNFDQPVSTDYAGNPNPVSHIHADLWAFHISPGYCPPEDTPGLARL